MHSADAWANDGDARDAIAIMAELPRDVARWALPYLPLFRPRERALSWKRARRLLEELRDLIAQTEIAWGSGVPRPNRPEAWARGLEQICCHPPKELPLGNHNYLRTIVYRIADELDAARERNRETEIRERRREEISEEVREANRRRAAEIVAQLKTGLSGPLSPSSRTQQTRRPNRPEGPDNV
jgi:hypothetical protein